MKKSSLHQMKPQDIVVLAKLISLNDPSYTQIELALSLEMSQSEISSSLSRSTYAGLLINNGKEVNQRLFFNFIKYGLAVSFPQHPGAIVPRYCNSS